MFGFKKKDEFDYSRLGTGDIGSGPGVLERFRDYMYRLRGTPRVGAPITLDALKTLGEFAKPPTNRQPVRPEPKRIHLATDAGKVVPIDTARQARSEQEQGVPASTPAPSAELPTLTAAVPSATAVTPVELPVVKDEITVPNPVARASQTAAATPAVDTIEALLAPMRANVRQDLADKIQLADKIASSEPKPAPGITDRLTGWFKKLTSGRTEKANPETPATQVEAAMLDGVDELDKTPTSTKSALAQRYAQIRAEMMVNEPAQPAHDRGYVFSPHAEVETAMQARGHQELKEIIAGSPRPVDADGKPICRNIYAEIKQLEQEMFERHAKAANMRLHDHARELEADAIVWTVQQGNAREDYEGLSFWQKRKQNLKDAFRTVAVATGVKKAECRLEKEQAEAKMTSAVFDVVAGISISSVVKFGGVVAGSALGASTLPLLAGTAIATGTLRFAIECAKNKTANKDAEWKDILITSAKRGVLGMAFGAAGAGLTELYAAYADAIKSAPVVKAPVARIVPPVLPSLPAVGLEAPVVAEAPAVAAGPAAALADAPDAQSPAAPALATEVDAKAAARSAWIAQENAMTDQVARANLLLPINENTVRVPGLPAAIDPDADMGVLTNDNAGTTTNGETGSGTQDGTPPNVLPPGTTLDNLEVVGTDAKGNAIIRFDTPNGRPLAAGTVLNLKLAM